MGLHDPGRRGKARRYGVEGTFAFDRYLCDRCVSSGRRTLCVDVRACDRRGEMFKRLKGEKE